MEMAPYGSSVNPRLFLCVQEFSNSFLVFHQSCWHLTVSEAIQLQLSSSHNKLAVYLLRRKPALLEDVVMGVNLLAHPRVIQYSSITHDSTADACWLAAGAVGQEQLLVRIWGQQGHHLLHH